MQAPENPATSRQRHWRGGLACSKGVLITVGDSSAQRFDSVHSNVEAAFHVASAHGSSPCKCQRLAAPCRSSWLPPMNIKFVSIARFWRAAPRNGSSTERQTTSPLNTGRRWHIRSLFRAAARDDLLTTGAKIVHTFGCEEPRLSLPVTWSRGFYIEELERLDRQKCGTLQGLNTALTSSTEGV